MAATIATALPPRLRGGPGWGRLRRRDALLAPHPTVRRRRGRVKERSTENFGRDRVEPTIGELRFLASERVRRIQRADAAGAFDLKPQAIRRLINAGYRKAIVRGRQAVTCVDEFWRGRHLATNQFSHRCGADFGGRITRERRLGYRTGDCRIAQ